MNSQNSEETKIPMIPPGFEMENGVENEEKHEQNETSKNKKSGKEENNVDESNQVMQNPVTIATVENKDESKTLESAVESHEQQSKQSTQEFEDYEKVELMDCNVGAGDHGSQNVLSEKKDVENESKTVQLAVTETGQQNTKPIESINVQMDENNGEKPKIVTLEEMFNESEKVQHDVIDTKDSGADQQNLKSMITSVKDNDSEAKSDKQRESDAVNVQKSEIYNFDPHAVTVASNVEHFKVISKTKSVDKEQSNNEADKIQQEEKPIMKNENNEIKEFLDTVLMIVSTESGDEDKSKVPQDKVVEEGSIPKNAKFEMGQKVQCQTAIVDSQVHNKSESDKTEVFADKVDVEKKKESIQSEIIQEGKDESPDIRVDTKDVTSGTDNVLKVSDISLKADRENKRDRKIDILTSDESQTNEQYQIQPAKGLVKSFSKTLINIFSCGNDVTSSHEDADSESIRDQNVQHGNNDSSQFHVPNLGKVAAVEEDKKDENIAADKIQVVTKNEVVQNQPIQTFNLFSSENIDAEIEKSRLQNDTIAQDEQKGHSYSHGVELEKVPIENRVTPEHAEVKEIPTEKLAASMQASETLKDEFNLHQLSLTYIKIMMFRKKKRRN
uniref:Uncharacterized protein n=1 Tax=Panagrolaimus davidi TaxID=227884 RepID=A0A914P9R1_9BILA